MARRGPRPITRPDDLDKPFVVRWHAYTRILLVESSVKLVAWTAMDYANNDDGSKVFPSDARLARETGFSEKTIRTAWAVMRALGMAVRTAEAVPHANPPKAAEYRLQIPDGWELRPVLGPHCGPFRCLYCGDPYAPSNSAYKLHEDGHIGWYLNKMAFCPAPRTKQGHKPLSCLELWEKEQGARWNPEGATPWKLFRQARGDDW